MPFIKLGNNLRNHKTTFQVFCCLSFGAPDTDVYVAPDLQLAVTDKGLNPLQTKGRRRVESARRNFERGDNIFNVQTKAAEPS